MNEKEFLNPVFSNSLYDVAVRQ